MKLLVILSRFPFPIEKGDKLRAYHQIRYLSKHNEIHLCALNDTTLKEEYIKALRPYCKSITIIPLRRFTIYFNILLAFLKGKPLQVGYFYNKKAQKKINSLINETAPEHIFCQLLRVAEYVKHINIPKTLDYQDVFSKGVERRLATCSFYMKPVLKTEFKRLLKYEHRIFSWFDNRTIISEPDRDLIPHADRDEIFVVPNGVDMEYFTPVEREKKHDLIFIGNMAYPPNIHAAEYLVRSIVPQVKKERPQIRVLIAGATPHPRVLALISPGVEVSGWVEDIRECYAAGKIFIAPMQIGTGLQNKLLEAMAMKIPCITSPLANSALKAKPGEEIRIAGSAEEYAGHIIDLLDNTAKAKDLAENAYQFVLNTFNWEQAARLLNDIMKKQIQNLQNTST